MNNSQFKNLLPFINSGDGIPQVYDRVASIGEILDRFSFKSVLLVADAVAYEKSGASDLLKGALASRQVEIFREFSPNPTLEELHLGLKHYQDAKPDIMIAVGGGTAIDLAKLIGFCAAQSGDPVDIIRSSLSDPCQGVPLIVVPTTAGTGSEATHFAVVYIEGQKYSVAHSHLLPDYAILDASVTETMPPNITADTGLDALCQAIESMWSVQSTQESIGYASEAIRLAWQHLRSAVQHPNKEDRKAMLQAAHLAGKAINISKTTAPHAISYTITSQFNVPHGRAVAFTVGAVLDFNSKITEADCIDPRGANYVQTKIQNIVQLLGFNTASEAVLGLQNFVSSLGCPTHLSEVGVSCDEQIEAICDGINVERLANNPRHLSRQSLKEILQSIR